MSTCKNSNVLNMMARLAELYFVLLSIIDCGNIIKIVSMSALVYITGLQKYDHEALEIQIS